MEYTRVPLMLSDDSDDDIFIKDSTHYGDLELKLLPPQNGLKPPSLQHRKHKRRKPLSACQIISLVLFILVLVLVVSLVIFAAINSSSSQVSHGIPIGTLNNQSKVGNQSKNWNRTFDGLLDSMSESNVRLLDVDGDGLDDIIFASASSDNALAFLKLEGNEAKLKEFCSKQGEGYPCVGYLYALRGYDGKVLWRERLYSSVTLINCADVDVDKDGLTDCILCGRPAGVQAVSSRTGKTLWFGDTRLMSRTWNAFQVLALPDVNGDGIPEVLVANGGDPEKEAEDHDRSAGRLLILSGATGESVGQRYLKMPDSKETYFSPVMYTCQDGSQYILFGSGGETIPGDLMVISLPDLYHYVTEDDKLIPGLTGQYNQWPDKSRHPSTHIITLYKGTTKGVMVPPVIVDVDGDGIFDIMASLYDGKNILYNGKDLQIMWSVDFPGQESYSTPAPGHFDGDGTLDFMTHWSNGQWPVYSHSQTVILSGKTGEIIWKIDSEWYEMSSDLSLHTDDPLRDMFLFKVKGRGANIHTGKDEILIRTGNSQNLQEYEDKSHVHRRHLGHESKNITVSGLSAKDDYRQHHITCEENANLNTEIFLMDRTIIDQPIKVLDVPIQTYSYTVSRHKDSSSPENQTMCVVLIPLDRSTGAVGDVDGDGQLDVVTITGLIGQLVDEGYSFTKMKGITMISKVSLVPLLHDTSQQVRLGPPSDTDQEHKWKGRLLPKEKQNWASYLGTRGNSIYRDYRR
ncbi:protein FAM234B-like [Argopecten irradians]|uniref:protein FAM234B-like n=1 Tax=Argopecten irradians TaxID=31199 RepID=UPI0037181D82